MTEAEWETRCDLAALYRILDHLAMTDLIYTHMTARVPGEPDHFLINRYGELFETVTASSFIKVDMEGEPVGSAARLNKAGLTIHRGVYRARPDIGCVMHTHTTAGVAVATLVEGLRPISQDSLAVIDELAYHDYGLPSTAQECEALGRTCASANCIVLRNHGLLALGATVPSAFVRMYALERACRVQVAAQAMEGRLRAIADDVQVGVRKRMTKRRAEPDYGRLEWTALLTMLERRGADHRR
jgi:ribulose-5-phosphate 4-epimerase/fuculose-1-phosphate aldolase